MVGAFTARSGVESTLPGRDTERVDAETLHLQTDSQLLEAETTLPGADSEQESGRRFLNRRNYNRTSGLRTSANVPQKTCLALRKTCFAPKIWRVARQELAYGRQEEVFRAQGFTVRALIRADRP
jgi:hypothetical protein